MRALSIESAAILAETRVAGFFDKFSNSVSRGSGKPATFVLACGLIVAWAASGPIFGFSETWQLVINTATTIVTFLMVFVLQHTQNRDGEAVQAKLDELILAIKDADNGFIGAERLTTEELKLMRAAIAEQVADAVTPAVEDIKRAARKNAERV
jgi:low affinity Fe/Cu permease